MRILVDIDGVLCEQVPPALARYNAAHGTVYTKADILIDDYTGHVNAFGVTGRKAILFDQPWNRNDKLHPLVTRCCGWSEVLETIREWEVMHP